MAKKLIEEIVTSDEVMMGPTRLKQPLPSVHIKDADPFLLLHHIGPIEQVTDGPPVLEVGAHPHRGFEPVSFIFSGELHHRDSRGNDSVIGAGGVQWMTAGMGIVHSEKLSKEFLTKGGVFEMIQLWVNLPQTIKMTEPVYQGFERSAIPTFNSQEGKVQLHVIAGEFKGLKGPVNSATQVTAYTLEMIQGGQLEMTLPGNYRTLVYQLHGESSINDTRVISHQMVLFHLEEGEIEIKAKEESLILIVAALPLEERVVSWGPYVMNTQSEILQAIRDYQMGKMGFLPPEEKKSS